MPGSTCEPCAESTSKCDDVMLNHFESVSISSDADVVVERLRAMVRSIEDMRGILRPGVFPPCSVLELWHDHLVADESDLS